MEKNYDPQTLEQKWRKIWEQNGSHKTDGDSEKPKFYALEMFPYPSGKIHMGHVRNYTIGDVIARYKKARGFEALHPIGWDAFGLPAENAAIQNAVHPAEWTKKNIVQMRRQLKRLGLSYDWTREITTCDPSYYKWEQWLFVRMLKAGLAYRKKTFVNWDPVDKTVLANEQVIDGKGWRSGAAVERRETEQWFLRISAYADELLEGLYELDWPESVKAMQRNWIGRSEGVRIKFDCEDSSVPIEVFTTRPDTLMGAACLALAPEHPTVLAASRKNRIVADFVECAKSLPVSEPEIEGLEKQGVPLGISAAHPVTGEKIPVWTANFVLMSYGTGAIMCVPAHDRRDFDFAKKYRLPVKQTVFPENKVFDISSGAYTEKGVLKNSGIFDGLSSDEAFSKIADFLEKNNKGVRQTNCRLRDWGISRQRYWGAPIPVVHCEKCGAVPVADEDLPVELPPADFSASRIVSLASFEKFISAPCPKCAVPAKRDTDTMDTFVESSWYFLRYVSPDFDDGIFDRQAVKKWLPVNQYTGGVEHAILHLLYSRFFTRALRDLGLCDIDEPFGALLTQGMVIKDGAKMSKSRGNTVDPDEMIKKYGADAVRLFILFAAPAEKTLEWNEKGIEGMGRFLKKLWRASMPFERAGQDGISPAEEKEVLNRTHRAIKKVTEDLERFHFNTAIAAVMELLNFISSFARGKLSAPVLQGALDCAAQLISPMAPHFAEEIWEIRGNKSSVFSRPWPEWDENLIKLETVPVVFQINGKARSQAQMPADADKDEMEKTALADEKIKRLAEGKALKKIVVVPGKLVNIVI